MFQGQNPPPAPNIDLPLGFHLTNLGRSKRGSPEFSIQIDGAWDAKTGLGGAAWVVCNQQQTLHRQGVFLYAQSAMQTEATTCLHAVRWARTAPVTSILINTDSLLLIKYLESTRSPDISIRHTLNAIR